MTRTKEAIWHPFRDERDLGGNHPACPDMFASCATLIGRTGAGRAP